MQSDEKQKYPVLPSVRYMFRIAWRHDRDVIFFCAVIAALQVGLNVAQLMIAPKILYKVETSAPLGELLATIAFFTGTILLLEVLCNYAKSVTDIPRIDVRLKIIQEINQKGLLTSYPNCDDPKVKKLQGIASEEAGDNHSSTEYIWTTLTQLLFHVGGFLVYLLMLSGIDPILVAVTIVTSVLSYISNQRAIRWERRTDEEWSKSWTELSYLKKCTESVETAKDIRIFGLSGWIKKLYADALKLRISIAAKREKRQILANLTDVVLTFLQNGIAYGYLLKITLQGNLSASAFLLYFAAVTGFTAWITGILEECGNLYRQCQGIGAVLAYLHTEEPFCFEGGRALPDTASCELRLEDVSFRYPGAEKPLFEHLNLTVHPGEKLAVVGLNGAGKTTLVKLLCGFYDPDGGRVTLNGVDIREYNRREYYGLLCAVYQNFSVLDVTIAENVAQATQQIDTDRVWKCLEMAGLSEFVRSLPDGLDTHVGRDVYLDGVLLSGGQLQRLMLARALYKDGPILLLDEPTAALDPIAESDIYQKYNSMTTGKTSIFISHRLASTRFCDRILFVADGAIAEEGTHEELLKLGGAYAQLYEIQSRYYREGGDGIEGTE